MLLQQSESDCGLQPRSVDAQVQSQKLQMSGLGFESSGDYGVGLFLRDLAGPLSSSEVNS